MQNSPLERRNIAVFFVSVFDGRNKWRIETISFSSERERMTAFLSFRVLRALSAQRREMHIFKMHIPIMGRRKFASFPSRRVKFVTLPRVRHNEFRQLIGGIASLARIFAPKDPADA